MVASLHALRQHNMVLEAEVAALSERLVAADQQTAAAETAAEQLRTMLAEARAVAARQRAEIEEHGEQLRTLEFAFLEKERLRCPARPARPARAAPACSPRGVSVFSTHKSHSLLSSRKDESACAPLAAWGAAGAGGGAARRDEVRPDLTRFDQSGRGLAQDARDRGAGARARAAPRRVCRGSGSGRAAGGAAWRGR